ncbi:MAG: hypothetical protein R3B09_26205 [Nannocystaceae bacterium]
MPSALDRLVEDFSDGLVAVDLGGHAHKDFRPGIGPWGEANAVRAALQEMQIRHGKTYIDAKVKRVPDLLIPGEWALEFKLLRPFGDNGPPAEHWSENILHPYPGNTSALGDCLKLLESERTERRAVIIFGYEHTPAQIPLEPAIRSFELLAREVLRVRLGPQSKVRRTGLIHPVHQQVTVYGYEVLGRLAESR